MVTNRQAESNKREIKSFVLRQGRMSVAQKKALENLYEQFVLANDVTVNFAEIFANTNPVILHIGFGMGSTLLQLAQDQPENNFIGVEVHAPGVGATINGIEKLGLANLKIYHHDVIEILKNRISDNTLDEVQIYFPDPWQKRKHHKRRLIKDTFLYLLHKKVVSNGVLHIATDWEDYANSIIKVLQANTGWQNKYNKFAPQDEKRLTTKYEARGLKHGRQIRDIVFSKC